MTDIVERLEFRASWCGKKAHGKLRYPSGEFVFIETERANFKIIKEDVELAAAEITRLRKLLISHGIKVEE